MTLVLNGVADYLTKQDGVRSVPLPEGDDVIAYLLEQADSLLYQAKQQGRNQVAFG